MVRIAHISDTHLGYRQYNLDEREQDIYDVLEEIADKILEERVDIIVHSGDLFDSYRPTTQAYYAFKSFLNKIDGKVSTFTILGDHDAPKRRGFPPHMLFDDRIKIIGIGGADYKIINVKGEEILIAGVSNLSRRYREVLTEELKKLDTLAAKHKNSILALHQAIDRFFPFEEVFELRLDEVPRNFKYCAMGHLHSRVKASHGNGELAYSGSTEIMRRNEVNTWETHGKGFYIVDMATEKVSLSEVNLSQIRPQLTSKLSYSNFEKELQSLVNSLGKTTKKPIVHVIVEGKKIDRQRVQEELTEAFTGKVLQFRQEIIEGTEPRITELKPGSFNINEVMKEYFRDENVAILASELFNLLRYDEVEEAKKVADEYFGKGRSF